MVDGGSIANLAIVVVTVAGLWIGAHLMVGAASRLARRVGLSELVIGLTVVAVGTSTPELVVSADAALEGLGDIAVGNVVGSSIFNLAFVLGVVSLVRTVPTERSLLHRDGLALVGSAFVGAAVLLDLTVTRLEGAVLAGAFVAYTGYLLWTEIGPNPSPDRKQSPSSDASEGVRSEVDLRARGGIVLVVGLGLVLASGHFLVEAASALARGAGVSEWVIGGTIVAAGTSTPEFAVSLVAMRRGNLGVSVGNVVGSNVFNVLAVMGLAAVLRPLAVSGAVVETLSWLLVVSVAMTAAMWTGRRLSRPEGALFACSEVVRWVLGLWGG